jgi:hypothetical protein
VRSSALKIQPIILAGGLRDVPLEEALEVPLLGLPIQHDRTVIELWADVLAPFDAVELPIKVITSSKEKADRLLPILAADRFRLLTDPFPHRGTAGVLADIRMTLPEMEHSVDYFLVVDQSGCPPHSLRSFLAKLSKGDDIVIGVSSFDRLTGILAFKPEVLDLVPGVGYQDFKEQTLVKARESGFRIAAHPTMTEALRIDHLSGVLDAVRYWASSESRDRDGMEGAFEGICSIHESVKADEAMIVDSICMKGSVIGAGAVVARSIIGPHVRIPGGVRVIDSVVDATMKFDSQRLGKHR